MTTTTSSSAIQGIDALYPVAGVDNDSQGFRDNFNIIKTQLTNAATDLTTIDTNTAKLNATNDFNSNIITDAVLIANTEEVNNIGPVSTSQNINWTDGNYQTLTVKGDITLSFTGWGESGKLCKIRLQMQTDDIANVVTFNAVGGTLYKGPAFPASFKVLDLTNYAMVDFWTTNAGVTLFADYAGEYSS
ncbi:MAG: hypothetical protein CMN33_07130 [Saprospirales bacterium]|nr:hypothetical protein [Saprospirales bacterium]|tara:strand:+ start:298 stop:864 length:567 start_codon:yes stop_codon:yes gene_type:complete